MTDEIFIKPGLISDHGWLFAVTFAGRRHNVLCSQAYWKKITHQDIPPMDLVRLGLQLALKQRITDSLPEDFKIEDLASRIPDFEKHLRLEAQTEAAGNPK